MEVSDLKCWGSNTWWYHCFPEDTDDDERALWKNDQNCDRDSESMMSENVPTDYFYSPDMCAVKCMEALEGSTGSGQACCDYQALDSGYKCALYPTEKTQHHSPEDKFQALLLEYGGNTRYSVPDFIKNQRELLTQSGCREDCVAQTMCAPDGFVTETAKNCGCPDFLNE